MNSAKNIQSRRRRRGERMSDLNRHRILLVDNEPMLRDTWTMVLSELGYDVATATDAFDALAQLRSDIPDLIISDLNMPRMSGFEFLKVMCVRFPKMPLVGLSGVYDSNDLSPGRLMVDAIYPKGRCNPATLGQIVADLLRETPARENSHASQPPPVQMPVFRNGPGRRVPCIELTCTECLRHFPVEFEQEIPTGELKQHIVPAARPLFTTPTAFRLPRCCKSYPRQRKPFAKLSHCLLEWAVQGPAASKLRLVPFFAVFRLSCIQANPRQPQRATMTDQLPNGEGSTPLKVPDCNQQGEVYKCSDPGSFLRTIIPKCFHAWLKF